MVTTTVGMFDGVLGHTSNLWPTVTLHTVLVVGASRFQHRFIDTSTAGNETEDGAVAAVVQLFDARRELDTGAAGVQVVGDDGTVTPGGLGDLTAVTGLFFERADDGTFGHLTDRKNITDVELSLSAAMDELSSANALSADNGFSDFSVLVRVLELDLGQWSATAWIVDDVLDEALDEAVAFGEV